MHLFNVLVHIWARCDCEDEGHVVREATPTSIALHPVQIGLASLTHADGNVDRREQCAWHHEFS